MASRAWVCCMLLTHICGVRPPVPGAGDAASLRLRDLPWLVDFVSLPLLVKMAKTPWSPHVPLVLPCPCGPPMAPWPPPLDCTVGRARSRTVSTVLGARG